MFGHILDAMLCVFGCMSTLSMRALWMGLFITHLLVNVLGNTLPSEYSFLFSFHRHRLTMKLVPPYSASVSTNAHCNSKAPPLGLSTHKHCNDILMCPGDENCLAPPFSLAGQLWFTISRFADALKCISYSSKNNIVFFC